jgi:hypothetical protein
MLFEDSGSPRIPLLITLGGRSPRTQSKLELLAGWAAQYAINPNALLTLHEAGGVLLIFDAFDEMDLVGEPALRADHFRTLWEFKRRFVLDLLTDKIWELIHTRQLSNAERDRLAGITVHIEQLFGRPKADKSSIIANVRRSTAETIRREG